MVVQYDNSKGSNGSVLPLVIRLAGPVPYASNKDGQKVPLPATNSVVSIIDVVKVT